MGGTDCSVGVTVAGGSSAGGVALTATCEKMTRVIRDVFHLTTFGTPKHQSRGFH